MGNRKISPDLKLAAVRLHERGILTTREILECVGFSRRTFLRICKLYRETGDVVKPRSEYIGRPRALNIEDVAYLTELVQHRPDWFLDELAGLVQRNRFISLHYTTIHRELHRAGISLKKLRKVAKERNEDVRADFMRRMAHYTSDELCFIDETSKDDRTPFRRHGRAKKSRRASMRGVFVRGRRVTAVAALTVDGIIAGHIVEGSLRRKGYLNFLEHSVLPHCEAYPGKNSVLVMDNARIHHGADVRELAEQFGVRIMFLPPYSPDLNPIEEAFSKIKSWIRRNYDLFAVPGDGMFYDVREALDIITPEDAQGYMRHSGYF